MTILLENQAQERCIDLTFVEDNDLTKTNNLTETKVRWIIDYKLGLDVAESNCEAAAQTHKPQLARYATLFANEKLAVKQAVFFLNLGKLIEI